ncbi:NADH-quinone oxidoreductase subunit L [soil metagenome]
MRHAVLAPYIVALPLLGSIVLLLVGKRLGRAAALLACGTVAAAFVLGTLSFFSLVSVGAEEREATVRVFEWIAAGNFNVGVDLLVDQLSLVMVLVVTGVGTLIHIYSIGYMDGDPLFPRFFAYLNLFAASMLLLVLADNLLLLYVGWEGVGLCSYLLIGFWFERPLAADAAKKAFIVNRIGDFAFLLGIFLLTATVGSLTVGQINAAAGGMSAGIATTAALLLFAGATGKSAQIPLYVWLPDAMEGPTPVSALIHAATMVTAGVYMVVRLSPVFEASGGPALAVVGWIGAVTALWAALMACTEYDIKRVLAYSTISQLGYMFLANGVGAYSAGMFHLVTHAFFKALMFLGAGAVMHALNGAVDMRKMGGLRKAMPITGLTFGAGWLAISGIVPFAGFFSKDAILASAWHEGEYALWAIGIVTALLTAFYMSRLYLRVFEGELRTPEGAHAHDAPPTMATALVPLGVLSLIAGVINLPGLLTLEHFLEPVVGASEVPGGLVPWLLGGIALVAGVAGIALAWALYVAPSAGERRGTLVARLGALVSAARNKFYVDEIYGRGIVLPGKAFANFSAYTIDARIVDGAVKGTGTSIAGSAEGLRRLQTGYVRNYGATFLIGVVIIFSLLVLRIGIT